MAGTVTPKQVEAVVESVSKADDRARAYAEKQFPEFREGVAAWDACYYAHLCGAYQAALETLEPRLQGLL